MIEPGPSLHIVPALIPLGTAEFSADGKHRYWLDRPLGGVRPLVDCGLNPSTADANKNDNTIANGMKYARRWGCGLFVKINLESYRTTFPKVLKAARKSGIDTVGLPDDGGGDLGNDYWIDRAVRLCMEHDGIFLAAWGGHAVPDRVRHVVNHVIAGRVPILCIKTNTDGSPTHYLYMKDSAVPIPWGGL